MLAEAYEAARALVLGTQLSEQHASGGSWTVLLQAGLREWMRTWTAAPPTSRAASAVSSSETRQRESASLVGILSDVILGRGLEHLQ
jgi:hypothetical protein